MARNYNINLEIWLDYVDGNVLFGGNGQTYLNVGEVLKGARVFHREVVVKWPKRLFSVGEYKSLKRAESELLKMLES